MIFLGIYCLINLLCFIGLLLFIGAWDDWHHEIFLIYPQLWDVLDENHINLAGKISAVTLLSIIFAPTIAVYFALLGVALLMLLLACGIWTSFCKMFKKKEER